MVTPKTYIRRDEHGVLRVGQTRVSLDSVVYGFQQGHSPETICQQYSALNLEEVYGAIAFYLANQDEINEYLMCRQEAWDELRQQADQNPASVIRRLRALQAGLLPVNP